MLDCATGVPHAGYAEEVRTISQRELRNDNAEIMRAVEAGESFVVTRNGTTIAVVRPVSGAEVMAGLPLARAGEPADYRSWPRVKSATDTAHVLAELRDER